MKKYIYNLKTYDFVRYFLIFVMIVLGVKYSLLLLIYFIIIIGFAVFVLISNMKLLNRARGNGIIYGGRGKGKGLLLNYIIRKDKTNPFCNVPYGGAEFLPDIGDYLNSISPLSIDNFINNDIEYITKKDIYEGRNVYIDDINVYLPNWSDSILKKKYPSLPPMLAINRHLYNAYCIITTQDRERPYKILKELQGDFSIKAIKSRGWGFLWNCIPILHFFAYTKYIYHEMPKSADLLPFSAKGLINETLKHGFLSSGQATKEVFEATNGVIRYGRLFQFKRKIDYDTRYFHSIVFGNLAPSLTPRSGKKR